MIGAPYDAALGIPSVTTVQPRNTTAPAEEVDAVLAAVPVWVRLAILLGWDCGLRIGTAVSLRPCDIHSGQARMRTKHGTWASTPLTPRVAALIAGAAAMGPPTTPLVDLLGCRARSHHKRTESARQHVRRAQVRLGLAGRWTPHDLRRSAARDLYERTKDLRKVQQLLSHKALQQTVWYLQDATLGLTAADMRPAPSQTTPTPQTFATGEEKENA